MWKDYNTYNNNTYNTSIPTITPHQTSIQYKHMPPITELTTTSKKINKHNQFQSILTESFMP